MFVLYILALIYFLFFAERFGQMEFSRREYHYNLVLFQEIRRFWTYRELLGYPAVAANLLGNVVGFMPFGLILPVISRNARGFFFITFSYRTIDYSCLTKSTPTNTTALYFCNGSVMHNFNTRNYKFFGKICFIHIQFQTFSNSFGRCCMRNPTPDA